MKKISSLALEKRKHQARQRIYDAIKQVREGAILWIKLYGERLKIGPLTGDHSLESGREVLCKTKRSRICVGLVCNRKGTQNRPLVFTDNGSCYLSSKDLYAEVLEHYSRTGELVHDSAELDAQNLQLLARLESAHVHSR